MRPLIYWSLLILNIIIFQGFGILLKENIKNQSSLYLRKKRVVDTMPNGNKPINIKEVPYIININKNNDSHCGGSILTPEIIISAAHCFREKNGFYSVLSGSRFRNRGTFHQIKRIIIYPHYNPNTYPDDLALLVIFPPIDLENSPNRKIRLYNGKVPTDILGTFSGWGCYLVIRNKPYFPEELRSILIPILSQQQCENAYHNHAVITNKEICTYDRGGRKCCGFGDSGGPLVVNGRLAGVMSWTGFFPNRPNPDVFMNLSHPEYRNWIISTIHNIENGRL